MKFIVFVWYIFTLSAPLVFGRLSLEHRLRTWDTITADDIAISRSRRSLDGKHSTFDKEVSFNAFQKQFTLSLMASPEIFTHDFKAYVHGEKGQSSVDLDRMSIYKGTVLGEPKSVVHAHMQGKEMIANIKTKEDTYVVEPSWRHLPEHEVLKDKKARMIIYRQSDLNMTAVRSHQNNSICDIDDLMKEIRDHEKEAGVSNSRTVTSSRRKKRAATERKICTLALVADYKFYKNMGNENALQTMYYVITLIERVNQIFKGTDWGSEEEEKGQYVGYGFQISSILVHNVSTSNPSYNSPGSWTPRGLLREFSQVQQNECLRHLFTYEDFDKGVLGLAYVGSDKDGAAGGVCSGPYDQGIGRKSLYLNTGLTTTQNWGGRILTLEADLVTTHELAHNFGAEHDDGEDPDCTPGESNNGNYIMYPAAVSGESPNNNQFSKCSKHNVLPVIKKRSVECFEEDTKELCGNFKIEDGEQCDAGYLEQDECCDKQCKLRKGKKCSRKNSPCCIDCQIASNKTICYSEIQGSCYKNTYCNGEDLECPSHVHKDDDTPCGDSGKCKDGQCQPFCVTVGMKPCLCVGVKENLCKRCCTPANATGEVAKELCQPYKSFTLRENATCSLGYCNNKTECIKQTQDVIERVWTIFEKIAPDKIGEFLADNIVGAVLVFSLLFWIPIGCLVNFVDKTREKHRRTEEAYFAERSSDIYRMHAKHFGSSTGLHVTQKSAAAKAGMSAKDQWNASKSRAFRKSMEELDSIAEDDMPTTSARLGNNGRGNVPAAVYGDVRSGPPSYLNHPDDRDSPPAATSRRSSRPQLRRQGRTVEEEGSS